MFVLRFTGMEGGVCSRSWRQWRIIYVAQNKGQVQGSMIYTWSSSHSPYWDRYWQSHFTDKRIEAWGGWMTYSRCYHSEEQRQDYNSCLFGFKTHMFSKITGGLGAGTPCVEPLGLCLTITRLVQCPSVPFYMQQLVQVFSIEHRLFKNWDVKASYYITFRYTT